MNFILLNTASYYGKSSVVNSLILANTNLNIQDNSGLTALLWGILTI